MNDEETQEDIENLTWHEAIKRAIGHVERVFSSTYSEEVKATIKKRLSHTVTQPLRIIKIGNEVAETYRQYGDKLPEPGYWLEIAKNLPYVAPGTYEGCQKCGNAGVLHYYIALRDGTWSRRHVHCDCDAGLRMSRNLKPFTSIPLIGMLTREKRISYQLGTVCDGDYPLVFRHTRDGWHILDGQEHDELLREWMADLEGDDRWTGLLEQDRRLLADQGDSALAEAVAHLPEKELEGENDIPF